MKSKRVGVLMGGLSAERDVFLEEQKDSAIAMYSRDVAIRVAERIAAIVKEKGSAVLLDADGAPIGGLVDAGGHAAAVQVGRAALIVDQAADRNEPAAIGTVDVVAAPLALRRVGALRAEGQPLVGIGATVATDAAEAPQ